MHESRSIRTDPARWQRLVEVTRGAAAHCETCDACGASCRWGVFNGSGPDMRGLLRQAQNGSGFDPAIAGSLWACNTCGACTVDCPQGVSIADLMAGLRSVELEAGRAPEKVERVRRQIIAEGNPRGIPANRRMAWAEDLELSAAEAARPCLLYFGSSICFDPPLQRIARAAEYVLSAAHIEFGVLEQEPDSGAFVRLLGDFDSLRELVARNVEAFHETEAISLVTLSPHDYDVFRRAYPLHDERIRLFHLTEYLYLLVRYELLQFAVDEDRRALYHDPCYLGRHHGVFHAPRRLLEAMDRIEVVEFSETRQDARCCGGGGGVRRWLEEDPGRGFADVLMQEAADRDVDFVVTACPECVGMLEASRRRLGIEGIEVRDVVEIAAAWWPHTGRFERRERLATWGRRRAE